MPSSSLALPEKSALVAAAFLGVCVLMLDGIALIGVGSIFYGRFDLMMAEWSVGAVCAGMLAVWAAIRLTMVTLTLARLLFGPARVEPEPRLAPGLRAEHGWR